MSAEHERFYTKDHEWLSGAEGSVTVGVTDYAVEQLGDIVHVELPSVGETINSGDSFGTIESTKTVSDLYLPAGGKVLAINQEAIDSPEVVGSDPYSKGWLIKVELNTPLEDVLDTQSYEAYIRGQD